jgi:hypothetical protein
MKPHLACVSLAILELDILCPWQLPQMIEWRLPATSVSSGLPSVSE